MVEKERLLQFADALRHKLQYFDELERVSAQFHSASLAVDSDSFLPLLERLDECITSVQLTPGCLMTAAALTPDFNPTCVVVWACIDALLSLGICLTMGCPAQAPASLH